MIKVLKEKAYEVASKISDEKDITYMLDDDGHLDREWFIQEIITHVYGEELTEAKYDEFVAFHADPNKKAELHEFDRELDIIEGEAQREALENASYWQNRNHWEG